MLEGLLLITQIFSFPSRKEIIVVVFFHKLLHSTVITTPFLSNVYLVLGGCMPKCVQANNKDPAEVRTLGNLKMCFNGMKFVSCIKRHISLSHSLQWKGKKGKYVIQMNWLCFKFPNLGDGHKKVAISPQFIHFCLNNRTETLANKCRRRPKFELIQKQEQGDSSTNMKWTFLCS